MRVIWLNGTVGTGKTAVGHALAAALPGATFVDGDDHAGSSHLPSALRWRAAVTALLRLLARSARRRVLVVAYPLAAADHARLRATCGRMRRLLAVVTLATPLALVARGRGPCRLKPSEVARARAMASEGYARRRFAILTVPNTLPSPAATAHRIVRLLRDDGSGAPGRGPAGQAPSCP